ncbi:MAG: hypothetical protein K6F60_01190, partial [Eubacterium sp.]|nr:hypothetical protein [Eubacterium sp.]
MVLSLTSEYAVSNRDHDEVLVEEKMVSVGDTVYAAEGNEYQTDVERYDYDSIVEEAEKEQE